MARLPQLLKGNPAWAASILRHLISAQLPYWRTQLVEAHGRMEKAKESFTCRTRWEPDPDGQTVDVLAEMTNAAIETAHFHRRCHQEWNKLNEYVATFSGIIRELDRKNYAGVARMLLESRDALESDLRTASEDHGLLRLSETHGSFTAMELIFADIEFLELMAFILSPNAPKERG